MAAGFFKALQFLTILPPPAGRRFDTEKVSLAEASPYFPWAGLLIALISYGIFSLAAVWLPWKISVLFLVFTPVLLSGGLHLDGFSDFCDGFGSSRQGREEILRIMKDSRIGAMGAIGVAFTLLMKYELLAVLAGNAFLFFFMMAASRTVQVVLASFMPYAGGESGMGRGFVGEIRRTHLLFAVAAPLALSVPLGWRMASTELIVLGFFIIAFAAWVKSRISGVTGDILGAASEISEICILLAAAGRTS